MRILRLFRLFCGSVPVTDPIYGWEPTIVRYGLGSYLGEKRRPGSGKPGRPLRHAALRKPPCSVWAISRRRRECDGATIG